MRRFDPDRVTALTLDCYGTLIDWEAGTIEALRPLLARHGFALSDDEIIAAAQEIEEPLCAPPFRFYRAVLAGVVEGFGGASGSRSGPRNAGCWRRRSRRGARSPTRSGRCAPSGAGTGSPSSLGGAGIGRPCR